MSDDRQFLKNQFLVAMPNLVESEFDHTVTYLCEHNEDGALGLVVNRPTSLSLEDLLEQMELTTDAPLADCGPIFWGGPVQPERGFVLHRTPGEWDSSLKVSDGVNITTSRDILEAIGKGEGPSEFLIALGYAGWGAGQLESEIIENTWLNTPAAASVLFDTPCEERWSAAAQLLGIDASLLSGQAGHA